MQWFPGKNKIVSGVDESNVGEGLREVASQPLRARIVFLREQPELVAQSRKPLEKPARIAGAGEASFPTPFRGRRRGSSKCRWHHMAGLP